MKGGVQYNIHSTGDLQLDAISHGMTFADAFEIFPLLFSLHTSIKKKSTLKPQIDISHSRFPKFQGKRDLRKVEEMSGLVWVWFVVLVFYS